MHQARIFSDLIKGTQDKHVTNSLVNQLAIAVVWGTQRRCYRCGGSLTEKEKRESVHEGECPLFYARFVRCPRCEVEHKLASPGVPYASSKHGPDGVVLEKCPSCSSAPIDQGEA